MKDSKIYQNIHQITSLISAHINMDEYCEIKNQQVALRQHVNDLYLRYHDHNYFEINYVLKGTCHNLIDDIVYEMETGDFVIIHPGVSHLLTAEGNSIVINILINAEWFKSTFQRNIFLPNSIFFNFIRKACTDRFYKYAFFNKENTFTKHHTILKKIITASKTLDLAEKYLLMEAYTIELICALCNEKDIAVTISATRGSETDIAGSMRAYVFENISDVTLNDLSNIFGYTVPHICRIFKNNYNETFKQILIKAKIDMAKSYLSHTDKKVIEISQSLGYESVEHFVRLFKKETSYTPSEYREKFPDDSPNK